MALMPRKVRAQQGTTAAPVKTPAEDWRLAEGGLWYPGAPGQSSPFRERDGVVAGAAPTGATRPMDVTAAAGGVFTIYPGRFVLTGTTALSGTYEGTVDAQTTRTIPGASLPGAGNYKAGLLIAHVYDQVYGDTQDGYDLEIVLGAAASTPAGAAFPTQPSNSLLVKQFTVDSTGVVTLGAYLPPLTVPRGGIVPVQVGETTNGSYVGQYRDHATLGLQRWDGSAWQTIPAGDTGQINFTPAAPITVGGTGAYYRRVGKTVEFVLDASYNGAYGANFVFTSLPVGFRPATNRYFQGASYSAGSAVAWAVGASNGNVFYSGPGGGSYPGMLLMATFLVP